MRWLGFEKEWLANYDGVWTVSEEDCQTAIREGKRPPDRTFHIANGVDIERFVPREEPGEAPEILYVGSFRHLPNIIGFEKLCSDVMPLVWREFPEARLRIVAGPEHLHFWHNFGRNGLPQGLNSRIEMHAFVEDLRPLYARASAVAVPLEVSAGTNIKVLEAMACGKAMVSTPVGCAGLGLQDGCDILIRKDWRDFASAVCDILSDQALRGRLGGQARRRAVENFSWTAIAERALQSYQVLVSQGRQGRQ
jgi:glycosyltransferase involved in cell wall biosynthesis